MLIEIETHDHRLEFDMMGSMSLKVGQRQSLPGGAVLIAQGTRGVKSFGIPEVVTFLLQHVDSLATGLVGAWIYDKLKGRAVTLHINKKEVQIEKGEITRVIEETITKEE